jgi:hypothetical protein
MTALAEFIRRHFGAEPGRLSFAYIASNIMSYLPQGKHTSMPDKMQAVADDAARPDANAARSMFTFSASKDSRSRASAWVPRRPFSTRGPTCFL